MIFTGSGIELHNLAVRDGVAWHPLGDGTNGDVWSLVEHDGSIIAGGEFTETGGVPANHIAAWDPVADSWSLLGQGLGGITYHGVEEMLVVEPYLVVAGSFSEAGGQPANNVAYWDGSSWYPIDEGTDGVAVFALAYYENELYLGGDFTWAGGQPSRYIARWSGFSSMGIDEGAEEQVRFELAPCWPNPTYGPISTSFANPTPALINAEVYDVLGRLVRTVESSYRPAGEIS